MEICSIFEDITISMIAFNLPSTPNHDIRSSGDKSFYDSLATDENLIDNVDIPDKRGINWQKAQKLGFNRASNLIICFGVGNKSLPTSSPSPTVI